MRFCFLLGFLTLLQQTAMDRSLMFAEEKNVIKGVQVELKQPDRAISVQSYADLERYAAQKAEQPFQPSADLPESISNLDYDLFRLIHYQHDHGVWWNQDKPFWFEAFHRGFVHKDQVKIHILNAQGEKEFPFDPSHFEYRGVLKDLKVPADTGYAGVKLAGYFPGSDDPQEMLTFLGASYFRARTEDSVYGASTRGLAVNVGMNQPEEFPAFREFWICEPASEDRHMTVLALMDSPSLTGAYQFRFEPGNQQSEMEVQVSLYFRDRPEKLGLAPLTSMWMWGDGIPGPPKDFRPKVHDSDGLLVKADDQWTWRALSRQSYPSVSRIDVGQLQGFGLIQRETDYEYFQDDSAQYHLRPSLWIQPTSPWPAGAIELIELPGAHEGIDNIGAYWAISDRAVMTEPLRYSYRISWFRGDLQRADRVFLAKASSTKITRPAKDSAAENPILTFDVLFEGESLAEMSVPFSVTPQISTIRGEVLSQEMKKVGEESWLLTMKIRAVNNTDPVELRVHLTDENRRLSETWSYLCAPQEPPYQFPQVYTRTE